MLIIKLRTVLSFFVILLFLPGFAAALEVGVEAPGFTLPSIAGEEVSLESFAGRPVLLKIGTTWCPGCKTLGKEIKGLESYLRDKDVVLLDIFVQDTLDMVNDYWSESSPSMTSHALLDDDTVYNNYAVYLIPRLLLVNAEQRIRFDSAGREVSAVEIKRLVDRLTHQGEGKKNPASNESERLFD